jgi:hypothetical protein
MRFLCNNCDAKISTEHYWEGLSVVCPNCGQPTELRYRNGQSIPNTKYSISFSQFQQLLTYEPYSKAVDPVVEKLLKCSIERTGAGVKLIDEDRSLIPLEVAHLELQLDQKAQRLIYGTAMSQWR